MFKLKYLLFLFATHSLSAVTTLHVTLNTDNNPGGIGDIGDLRYCLNSMNQSLNATPDDYVIIFDFPMTIQLNGILPMINNSSSSVNITIGNPGTIPNVTIDGNNGSYSGFFIPMGNVKIQNMIFQNLHAKGGDGGYGISGGGGGLGAGGAIYLPETFLNGSYPSVTLMNVFINQCMAIGGNGGNSIGSSSSGFEGGGGGGGFSGNGGSVITIGNTGGAGGGGFGGDGGSVTLSVSDILGGGGGGGGGIGSRATLGVLTNLGTGGSDQTSGLDGNGYGLTVLAGSGGGNQLGGNYAGGGGGGGAVNNSTLSGGGGGGSAGSNGLQAQGLIPPGGGITPSGGNGGDGGGAGGGGIVFTSSYNGIDGKAGSGGYAGGGGGGSGAASYDTSYTVEGGSGGIGGGGGGGGVNLSGSTLANGGNSLGGGGGGGGGPSSGITSSGGIDIGNLGGGNGGFGANVCGAGFGGGGGGGGSGLGGAIFIDRNLNLTIQAIPQVPTLFNTINTSTMAGLHGISNSGGTDGLDGSAFGNSIFLRAGASLRLVAEDIDDLLTIGDQVQFDDDTNFGGGGTRIEVRGNGTVVYNGTTDYLGTIQVNNANFKVNGIINAASLSVCRNISFSSKRGVLSGTGSVNGSVFVNSGIISPDSAAVLTLGSLSLNPEDAMSGTLGSLVHIEISPDHQSKVQVTGSASLAGVLEIDLNPNVFQGTYKILTSSGITGSFDHVVFTGMTPNYQLSYVPLNDPKDVELTILGYPITIQPPSSIHGKQKKNNFGIQYELYNQLNWTASPTADISGYIIYRNGKKIDTVNSQTYTYQDPRRIKGKTYTYAVTAFNTSGDESLPINIIIRP